MSGKPALRLAALRYDKHAGSVIGVVVMTKPSQGTVALLSVLLAAVGAMAGGYLGGLGGLWPVPFAIAMFVAICVTAGHIEFHKDSPFNFLVFLHFVAI